MANNGQNEKMIILATKYLSGNATSEEIRELEAWVLADPENKKGFIAFKKAWMLSGMERDDHAIDVDKIWQQTSKQLFGNDQKKESKGIPMRRLWLQYAASIAFLIAAAFLIYQFIGRDQAVIVETTNSIKDLALPDGSLVRLNQASSLRFSENQNEPRRVAILGGDAFFDVKRDEERPFIIQTQGLEIEVLGTSFYVDSREGQPEIQVIVESGSVAVRAGSHETILAADEKAVFQKEAGSLIKKQNEDPNYSSLKTKILTFEDSQLEDVIFAINRQFNADLSIAITDLTNCKITATFENKSLEAMIIVIERTLGIDAIEEGGKVILSGTNCN